MEPRNLLVLLEGGLVGEVTQENSGRLRFDYDENWRNDPEATPLSLSMPLTASLHPHRVVNAFMWGLLPDNERVLDRWGRDNHVSSRNPFALLRYVGEECAGAVQFVRPERIEDATRGGHVEWLAEKELSTQIRLLRQDPTSWQTAIDHGQFSLAGAQAKMVLLRDGDRWGRPSGRTPTTHIIKPAIEGFDDHDLNEHLCLQAARLLGLRAAASEVRQFGEERAIVVERYDRFPNGGQILRVHQEDLCQALGVRPTMKYQREGGPSPLQIAALLRDVDPAAASDSILRFIDAMAFNWLIGGTDAHAKNYSILLSGRQVRLAPLYDVASALPYPNMNRPGLRLAMSIAGEYRLDWVAKRHWLRAFVELRVDSEMAFARITSLTERVTDSFATAAKDERLSSLDTSLPSRLTDAVRVRSAQCLRLLQEY